MFENFEYLLGFGEPFNSVLEVAYSGLQVWTVVKELVVLQGKVLKPWKILLQDYHKLFASQISLGLRMDSMALG